MENEEREKSNIAQNEAPMAAMKNKNSQTKGILLIVISAFSFSLMSLFVRFAGDLPTFQKAFFRNSVAALVSFVLLLKDRSLKMKKGSFVPLLLRSLTGTVGIVCNFYAIDHMNISDASIFNKLSPFFTVIFSVFILKEKASLWDWILVAAAFCGAVFVAKPSFDFSSALPALIGLLGGVAAGVAYTFVRKLGMQGERPTFTVFFFSLFSCIAVVPFMIADHAPMTLSQVGWLLLAGGAASCAQFSLTTAYKYAPAKEISVFDYSQVLFAAIWGILFLSEIPDYLSIIGYAIIIGAAIVKWLIAKKKKS